MDIKEIFRLFKRSEEEPRPQAGTRFGISWPLLAALCLILVCAVGWAFFMGLMVGRGQNPQESFHAATGLMKPEEAEPLPEEPEPEPPFASEDPQVAPPVAAPAREPAKRETPKRETAKKETPRKIPPPQATPAQTGQRYAYTFQAGAFKSQADANSASSKLNRVGLKTTVRKSGKVWLAVISLQGGAADVAAMRQKVKKLKMDRPMQLTKTAIEPKKRKRG